MNSFVRLLLCILVLGLTSCVMHHAKTSPQNLDVCRMACLKNFEVCKNQCVTNCSTCSAIANCSAAVNYTHYVNEKKIQGKLIARDLNSYRDPLQCKKIACDCVADINVCFQGCAGMITKQLNIVQQCS